MTQVYDQILPNVTKFMAKMSRENTKNRQNKLDCKLSPIHFGEYRCPLFENHTFFVESSFTKSPYCATFSTCRLHIAHTSFPSGSYIGLISGSHIVHPSCPHIVPKSSSYRPQEWSNFKPRFCPPPPQMRCQRPQGQGL